METIYISLEEEGVLVWRPVQARKIAEGIFEMPQEINIPAEEIWQFKPGDKVKCKWHTFQDGKEGLIAYSLSS